MPGTHLRQVQNLRINGGPPPLHTHNHHVNVAVCDPHSSAGPRHAAVTPVAVTGHPVVALACLRCFGAAVPSRPVYTSTLRSYFPQSTLTRHLSRHYVSYYYSFRSCLGQAINQDLFPGWRKLFSSLHNVQIGSRAQPVSYSMNTDRIFLWSTATGS